MYQMNSEERAKIEIALSWALEAHKGASDRNGCPVVMHPIRVAVRGNTPDEIIVGFLHDTVEDTDITIEQIRYEFGGDIAEAVDLLTNDDKGSYDEYIDRIINSHNDLAITVKLNDLSDNLDRSIKVNNETLIEKYSSAKDKIMKATGKNVI